MARTAHLLPVFFVAAIGAFAACLGAETYVYWAQQYDDANDCLKAYTPVETVTGGGTSSFCEPICLTVDDALFVSTICPPLPPIATQVDPKDPACIAALAAQKRGGTCDEPAEAGAEEGGSEAGEDADTPETAAPDDDAGVDAADSAPIKDAAEAG